MANWGKNDIVPCDKFFCVVFIVRYQELQRQGICSLHLEWSLLLKKTRKKIYKIRYEWLLRKLCLLFILMTINFWLKVLWVFFPQQTTCIKFEFTFSKSVHSYLLMSSKFICFSNNVTPPPPKAVPVVGFFLFVCCFFYVSTCIDVHKLGGNHQSCKVTYL